MFKSSHYRCAAETAVAVIGQRASDNGEMRLTGHFIKCAIKQTGRPRAVECLFDA